MPATYSISLEKIIKEIKLDTVYLPESAEKIMISNPEVDRPGLALTGFFDIFEPERIHIIGKAEHKYLTNQEPEVRHQKIVDFISKLPSAVVVTTGLEVFDDLIEEAKKYGVPLFSSKDRTTTLMAAMIASSLAFATGALTTGIGAGAVGAATDFSLTPVGSNLRKSARQPQSKIKTPKTAPIPMISILPA